jgi:hypothetical protein
MTAHIVAIQLGGGAGFFFGGRGGGTSTVTSPLGAMRQDKRCVVTVPMNRFSSKVGGGTCSMPLTTLTRQSPHVPLPPQAVSTMTPALRAA